MRHILPSLHSPYNSRINQILPILDNFLMNHFCFLLWFLFLKGVHSDAFKFGIELWINFKFIIWVDSSLNGSASFFLDCCLGWLGGIYDVRSRLFFLCFLLLVIFMSLLFNSDEYLMLDHSEWHKLLLALEFWHTSEDLSLGQSNSRLLVESQQDECLWAWYIQVLQDFIREFSFYKTSSHLDTPRETLPLLPAEIVLLEVGIDGCQHWGQGYFLLGADGPTRLG